MRSNRFLFFIPLKIKIFATKINTSSITTGSLSDEKSNKVIERLLKIVDFICIREDKNIISVKKTASFNFVIHGIFFFGTIKFINVANDRVQEWLYFRVDYHLDGLYK